MDINIEQFITYLRSALHHLYDPDQLRRNPLTGLLGLAGRMDAPAELQKILLDAVDALKPRETDPLPWRGWNAYDLLFFRYVRGYERQAVANQLGISDRQLSRDQRAALESLAQHLLKTYRLEDSTIELPAGDLAERTDETGPLSTGWAGSQESTAWLDKLPDEKPASWKPVLDSVLELLQPLAAQHQVTLEYAARADLPDLLVAQIALRHALLNTLGPMISLARRDRLAVEVQPSGLVLTLRAVVRAASSPAQTDLAGQPGIAVARRLVERAGGTLQVAETGGQMQVTFAIPALAQIPVLVIDDNADTIQLFQRYSQDTRFSVTGAGRLPELPSLLASLRPRIILLDVMMPEIDGWDLLTRLRQDPLVQEASIIICSILPQEALALSLGADAFLQKPVLPQDFLKALEECNG